MVDQKEELRRGDLIDWGAENQPSFGYSPERVRILSEEVRKDVASWNHAIQSGNADKPSFALGGRTEREKFGALYEKRQRALDRYNSEQGLSELAETAQSWIEILRELDRTILDRPTKLTIFFERIGGEDVFELVFQALSCAGALHGLASELSAMRMIGAFPKKQHL